MKILNFWRMSFQAKKLFFINFFLCGVARVTIKLFSYKKINRYFGGCCGMTAASTIPSKDQIQQAVIIGRSIKLSARYTPWQSTCLTQAIVAKFWCQRYNIPYLFFIGFAKASQKPLGHDAHAWVTVGPVAIVGGHSLNTHHVVSSYSNCIIRNT